ncbi:cupredoxin domain-containing protein [Lipingzhangella sp. LS1_29]|uniref:Cupredoxin domain-containing protein n=1 Tax=Lipingzhangella rawalii TaxID=2055835 RepID=A0ABU2H6V9_9ACTN|nr:cupredoxin domain-containing protein [Lipingzhangella rawalii]MDS1271026.1 cupredoxin domain-containing protein [Lipingzhangella rawalii]
MVRVPTSLTAVVAAVALFGVSACNDAEEEPQDPVEDTDVDGDDAEAEDDAADDADPDAEPRADEVIAVEATEMAFEGLPETVPAGTVEIELDNVGDLPHDIVVEELGDEVVASAEPGESASGTVELEPGEYTVYCSIGNHRQEGMEEVVTVE